LNNHTPSVLRRGWLIAKPRTRFLNPGSGFEKLKAHFENPEMQSAKQGTCFTKPEPSYQGLYCQSLETHDN